MMAICIIISYACVLFDQFSLQWDISITSSACYSIKTVKSIAISRRGVEVELSFLLSSVSLTKNDKRLLRSGIKNFKTIACRS